MENFLLALNVVFPMFFLMMLGVILKRIKMVDERSLTVMNSLIFRVFMSTLLFLSVYNIGDLSAFSAKNLKLMLYAFVSVLVVLVLAWLIFVRLIADKKRLAVMIQGVYRGNFILFGLAIAGSLYGDAGLGIVSILTVVTIPTFNILAVIILEYYSGKEISRKKLIKQVSRNPLVIATVIGILFLASGIKLPKPIYKSLNDISKIATPLAFIVLGAELKFGNMLKNMKYLIFVDFLKLVVNPLISISIGKVLGFQGAEIVALLAMTACPTAVSSFTMAKEMNVDGNLAGEIVATTSLVSIATIFCWILILKSLAWI